MEIKSYRDLVVWKKSMAVAKKIYSITNKLPKTETYGLISQMRRFAVSIPSNIVEGFSRHSVKAYRSFLVISHGSKSELETQLLLCVDIGYLRKV